MKIPNRRQLLLATLLIAAGANTIANAKDPKELVIGTSAGPYADQVKLGIKPILEKQGYKVKLVEFNDYIQPTSRWPRVRSTLTSSSTSST